MTGAGHGRRTRAARGFSRSSDASRNYKDKVYMLHYNIAGTNKFMCGSNDWPAAANKIMEKRG